MDQRLAQSLFAPKSVALVGASDDPSKVPGRPLAFLQQHGFEGQIWPVNARRRTVQGHPAYPDINATPDLPDLAFILLNADAAMEALEQCVAAGVAMVAMLADGFSEAGEAGKAREARLREILAGSGTRLIGPQSLGLVDTANGLALTANAAFAEPVLQTGGTMLLSHSGSMIGALLSRAQAQGIGWRRLVSVGNELDLSMGEIGLACVDDPTVRAFALFLETIRDRNGFVAFTRAAAQAGKPVVALRLGRSAVGRGLAQTHTGAMLGDGAGLEALLLDCGVCCVESLDGLIHAADFLARTGKKPVSAGVAIVTTTGGGGALAAEAMATRDVPLYTFPAARQAALEAAGLPAPNGPVLDVTLAGTRPDVMAAALATTERAMAGDRGPDITIAAIGSSARFSPELAVSPLVDGGQKAVRAAFLVPDAPESTRLLREAGVPVFPTAEALADVLAGWSRRRARWPEPWITVDAGTCTPDSDETAFKVLERLGISIAVHSIQSADSAALAAEFGYPLALKGILPGVRHRTEAGLVYLNIPDEAVHRAALTDLQTKGCETVLSMPMVDGLAEAIIGYRIDPVVGPLIMVAPGGVLAELYDDRAVRTAPVNHRTALDMIDEVEGFAPLRGYRNLPEGDLEALAAAIVALSQAAVADPAIVEAEANPVIVRRKGDCAIAVDALVIRAERP